VIFIRFSGKLKSARFLKFNRRDENLQKSPQKNPDKQAENFSDKVSDSVKGKQIQEFYEFAGFRLDINKRRLKRDGEIVPLTPKEFDVLFFLMENAGRVVEKDELLDEIWKDTFVEEGTLTRNVSWLRKKLAEKRCGRRENYRNAAEARLSLCPEIKRDEKALVIKEQTIQHIQIEEIIEIEPDENALAHENFLDAEPSVIADPNQKALSAASPQNRFLFVWLLPAFLILGAIVFFASHAYFSTKQAKVVLATKIAPFSGLPGRENSPAFSPDGRQMVFAWDGGTEGATSDVYVKLIGAGDPVRLTNTETEEINPVFAPDGKTIAFVRVFPDHNEIISIPALGGGERKIYEKASYASLSFSPDGKFLAHANLDLSEGEAGIFTINLATGEKSRLTTPALPAVDHTPRFSPDGKSLAFIRYFGSFHREIFVLPAEGGEPRQITSDDVRIYGLAWNADSQKIFCTSFRETGQLNLWQISLSGDEPQLIPTGGRGLQSLAISPNGRTIAFVDETEDENIWEIEIGGKQSPLIRSARADHSQQFSPDGSQIVFASDRTGNYEIWITDADGKNQRQLTDSVGGSAGSPRFSPDGKLVAYDAQIAGGSDVYIVSVNGGASRRLTDGEKNNSLPAWSADGSTFSLFPTVRAAIKSGNCRQMEAQKPSKLPNKARLKCLSYPAGGKLFTQKESEKSDYGASVQKERTKNRFPSLPKPEIGARGALPQMAFITRLLRLSRRFELSFSILTRGGQKMSATLESCH
jgi:Tol biopolymer transport system component